MSFFKKTLFHYLSNTPRQLRKNDNLAKMLLWVHFCPNLSYKKIALQKPKQTPKYILLSKIKLFRLITANLL